MQIPISTLRLVHAVPALAWVTLYILPFDNALSIWDGRAITMHCLQQRTASSPAKDAIQATNAGHQALQYRLSVCGLCQQCCDVLQALCQTQLLSTQ